MLKTIFIEGMSCEHCAAHVKQALEELGGKNVVVDLAENVAKAELDASDETIIAAIDDAGYDVTRFQ